jgi:CheY-like chemotaxis protein
MIQAPILLVDDDENDLFLLKYAFNQAGVTHPLVELTNGQQALDYLFGNGAYTDRRQHPPPAFLLLDLKLPIKSGFEVLRELRDEPRFKRLVVIVLSASGQPHDVARAYDLGANSYIVKPSGIDDLRRLAERFRAWWLELNLFAPLP